MPIWKAFILLLAVCVAGCSQDKCPAAPGQVVAGTTNEFYTVQSAQKIETAPGAKATSVQGQDGQQHGVVIVARSNNATAMSCGCIGACSSNCTETRTDTSTTTTITCSGNCTSSENTPCGSCGWSSAGGWGSTIAPE